MTTFLARPAVSSLTRVMSLPGYIGTPPPGVDLVVPKRHKVDINARKYGDARMVWPSNYGIQIPRVMGGTVQVRYAHTDIEVPDFTEYRRDSTKDPTKRNLDTEDQRKLFTYLTYGVAGTLGLYATKVTVRMVAAAKGPGKHCYAVANTEVDLSGIPEGKVATVIWRGKPVFIRHRSQKDIDRERAVNLSELRDPQTDEERVKDPKWLIALGVCTHLGCVPIAGQGAYDGWYCPCHGSHYDGSGRIRRGPAPLNLSVPDYVFLDEKTLLIGTTNPNEG